MVGRRTRQGAFLAKQRVRLLTRVKSVLTCKVTISAECAFVAERAVRWPQQSDIDLAE